jgi:hypothetical protein
MCFRGIEFVLWFVLAPIDEDYANDNGNDAAYDPDILGKEIYAAQGERIKHESKDERD